MREGTLARVVGLIGGERILESICPGKDRRGGVVELIRGLGAVELSGGAVVVSLVHLELVRGGLWYAVDALDAAHEVFQADHSALGSYWHGMMHRREGDFWNACYWFRKAGRIPALKRVPGFDPVAFTNACEAGRGREGELLRQQRLEWEALMEECLSLAVGEGR